MIRILLVACSLAIFANIGHADEPKKQEPEKIPAPKTVVEPSIIIMPYVQRTDTRDVWQHYGVNAFGRFVPRVIVTPYGPLNSRNLEPYPWTQGRPVLPIRVD
jgi:hypothetical protein